MKNKSILITGGTGSFGKNFIKYIYKKHKNLKKIVVFSRDEWKQHELSNELKIEKKKIRFFLGDVRDKNRLITALKGIDIVIHAAALKQVPAAEYNPLEFIKTNISGANNVIEAALKNNVKKVIALSTDKAAAPINLYGATKLCSDKLFSSANLYKGSCKTIFSIVRYGNVFNSRGSVVPLFIKMKNNNLFPITHENMTRFNITLIDSVKMVEWAINNAKGGEIFVPKLKSYKILDLAKALNPNAKIKIIGIRPGEKIHEQMITTDDSYSTYDIGKYFAILNPSIQDLFKYYKKYKKFVPGESYSSDKNEFLNERDLKILIKNFSEE